FASLDRLHLAAAGKEPVQVEKLIDGGGAWTIEPETPERQHAPPGGGRQIRAFLGVLQLPARGIPHRIPVVRPAMGSRSNMLEPVRGGGGWQRSNPSGGSLPVIVGLSRGIFHPELLPSRLESSGLPWTYRHLAV